MSYNTNKMKFLPMLVEGSFLTGMIRRDATPHETCAKCGIGLTGEQVTAIVECRARIEGDNRTGYVYTEELPTK